MTAIQLGNQGYKICSRWRNPAQKNGRQQNGAVMTDGLLESGAMEDYGVAPAAAIVPAFDCLREEARVQFGRPAKKPDELVYELTSDAELLHQYRVIYEREFSAVHNADYRYTHADEEDDRHGHIVVVRQGNCCVGGARISVRTPHQPHPLPIELDGFRLEEHFPELKEKKMRYGQVGRFCLLPEFRGGAVTSTLMWHLYRKVVALALDEVFGTATIANARVYKQNCISMGLKDVKIHRHIELPLYPMCEQIRFYLISGSVDTAHPKRAR